MNKVMIVFLAMGLSLGLKSQGEIPPGPPQPGKRAELKKKKNPEKLKALKVGYLTDALELTPNEAEEFWPVYNQFDSERRTLRTEMRPGKRIEDMSEKEAEDLLERTALMKERMHDIDVRMDKALSGILSAKKLLRLKAAEKNFQKKMVDKMKKKRKKGKKRKFKQKDRPVTPEAPAPPDGPGQD